MGEKRRKKVKKMEKVKVKMKGRVDGRVKRRVREWKEGKKLDQRQMKLKHEICIRLVLEKRERSKKRFGSEKDVNRNRNWNP